MTALKLFCYGFLLSSITWSRAIVTDFGAIPNDGIDDTEAFRKALTTNRQLYIPAGVFMLKELQLPSNTTLMGAGIGKTILKRNNPDDPTNDPDGFRFFIYSKGIHNPQNYAVKNLSIDGNRGENTNSWQFQTNELVLQAQHILVENVEIYHSRNDGLVVSGKHIVLKNIYAHHNNKLGIYASGGEDLKLLRCKASFNTLGIGIAAIDGFLLENCVAQHNLQGNWIGATLFDLGINRGSKNGILRGGFYDFFAVNTEQIGNVGAKYGFYNTIFRKVSFGKSFTMRGSAGNRFEQCEFRAGGNYDSWGYGILWGCSNNVFVENLFGQAPNGWLFWLRNDAEHGACKQNVFFKNTFRGNVTTQHNQGYGIKIENLCQENIFQKNTVRVRDIDMIHGNIFEADNSSNTITENYQLNDKGQKILTKAFDAQAK